MSESSPEQLVAFGREVLEIEAKTLMRQAQKLSTHFAEAVRLILPCKGRLVVTGLGKSGHIAQKIASTMSSTGTPSFFLHPSEALHGDLGKLSPQDCLLAVAHGGETWEVLEVAKFARRMGIPVIALTGKVESTLGQLARVVIDGSVEQEACPLNLAPTSSSTLALALGDALAVALMQERGFRKEQFADLHPAGTLGRKLARVSDYMRPRRELPLISSEARFFEVLQVITQKNFGIAIVEDQNNVVAGVVTDGDLRRGLLKFGDHALKENAESFMKSHPKTISSQALVEDAMLSMEQSHITALLVVDESVKPGLVGLLRMHDLLAAKIV